MSVESTEVNVRQAVPFFGVTSMDESLRFYMEGLAFTMKYRWIDEGKLRWCWLEIGTAGLMLQEYKKEGRHSFKPEGKLGVGVSICFQCRDALRIYRESRSRGLQAGIPFVGNAMWVVPFTDPDGYNVLFESPTDAPEESRYTESG
jgi:lactoylglutathione lyase